VSTVLTVAPSNPAATGAVDGEAVQVSLAVQSVRHVLAVPVAALLALAGGGYGLEVVEPAGQHRLVGVRTGVYAGGDVQVLGGGLRPGTKVVVAQ
jgi:multidrug efflux pump subunit AcrA (membrane-fusion protein)